MILDGKNLKNKILDDLKEKVKSLDEKPSLCVIQIGSDPASNVYISQKEKMCNYIGYGFVHKKFDINVLEEDILKYIDQQNKNSLVNGIIVQMPLPYGLDVKKIQNKVDPKKDVDGLNDANIIKLITKKDGLFPCTALGVIELLDYYSIDVSGKDIVIVGRSSLVGMPLFHMLENRDATVTLTHSKTRNLEEKTKIADIVISAVGKKHLIKSDMIKESAIVIDVGINRENNKLYGDCDFENIKNKVSYITPVPGGVGPMTIAMLAKNILKAYKIQNDID